MEKPKAENYRKWMESSSKVKRMYSLSCIKILYKIHIFNTNIWQDLYFYLTTCLQTFSIQNFQYEHARTWWTYTEMNYVTSHNKIEGQKCGNTVVSEKKKMTKAVCRFCKKKYAFKGMVVRGTCFSIPESFRWWLLPVRQQQWKPNSEKNYGHLQ